MHKVAKVLILVVMEEGQRLVLDRTYHVAGYVLILVVMEEGQRPLLRDGQKDPLSRVLILVVMEEGQRRR